MTYYGYWHHLHCKATFVFHSSSNSNYLIKTVHIPILKLVPVSWSTALYMVAVYGGID